MPDREAFSGQAQSLLTRYPSLQSVGWVPWIPATQRYAHESAQAYLLAEYRIVERVASGELVNATERADYFPLQHIASRTDNLTALGYDFGANAVQRRMLNQARDTGQWQLSERIERDVLPNTQGTVQVVVPVYDQVQPVTRMERRQALRGFIVGYWHIDEMIAPWFPLSSFAQMHLRIADLQANEATSQLFGLGDRTASSSTQFYLSALALEGEFVLLPEPSERVSRTVLAKGGREWVMEATPTAHYFEQRRTAYSFYVFGAILFGFVGLSGYGWRVMQRHVLQWNQLGENNQQLAEQNKSLVRLTRMDTLLGVANRRFLMRHYTKNLAVLTVRTSQWHCY
ncbi:phytochrome-like protein [Photobacterium aphoticum]|uniref:Phytochrome-like protein n=1 Tax=Photobacterium aphoticum TaxID=754436 RepID=A0A090QTX2_9GAMM|nr:phytochrome-like protein [Photobacterium aphoticum]